MFMPSRGGSRGGKDQFDWDDVKADKYRENYLGHSVMAPIGRWQKGRDLTWYSKDKAQMEANRKAEMMAVKQQESMALNVMLGRTDANSNRSNNLTKAEIADLFKRGQTERNDDNIERLQGVGFLSSRAALMTPDSEANKGVGKSNITVYEKVLEDNDKDRKDGQKKKKKKKKEKKNKKKKHSYRSYSSDDNRKRSDVESHHDLRNITHGAGTSTTAEASDPKKRRRRHDSSSDEDANFSRSPVQNKHMKDDLDSSKKHSENRANKSRSYEEGRSRRRNYSSDEMNNDRDGRNHHRNNDGNRRGTRDSTHDRYKYQKKSHHSKY